MASRLIKRGSGNKTNTPGLPILDDTAATSATSIGRKLDEVTSSSLEVTSATKEGGVSASASGTGLMAAPASTAATVATVQTSPSRPTPAARQTSDPVRVSVGSEVTTNTYQNQANTNTPATSASSLPDSWMEQVICGCGFCSRCRRKSSNCDNFKTYIDAGIEFTNVISTSLNSAAFLNNDLLYAALALSVTSSMLSFTKNAVELEKEFCEQDGIYKEIKRLTLEAKNDDVIINEENILKLKKHIIPGNYPIAIFLRASSYSL